MFGKTNSSTILNGSVTKGVSLTHENVSSSSPVINNNISIQNTSQNDEPSTASPLGQTVEITNESTVSTAQSDINNHDTEAINCEREARATSCEAENKFLKAILKIYINQKLYFSGKYIVVDINELAELIHVLVDDKVEVEAEPIEVNCLGNPKLPYAKIINIWVNKNGQRCIFKYTYPQLLTLFDEYNISLKVVRA